jgi:hypothetical protein
MKIGWQTLGVLGAVLVVGLASCVADRGPLKGPVMDAGKGTGDGPADGSACPAITGGNSLSFDLDCSGEGDCTVSTTVEIQLDTKSAAYPGCGDGEKTFEIVDLKGTKPLTGTDQSSLELSLNPYVGLGDYMVTATNGSLLDLSVMPPCKGEGDAGGTTSIALLIAKGGPMFDSAAPPFCSVTVETDCMNDDGTHNVTGKLSCSSFASGDETCTLSHGKFQFGNCVP